MKWTGGRESSNVDDRRGLSAGGFVVGGGVIGVIVYILNLLLGGDPSQLPVPQQPQQEQTSSIDKKQDDERARFTKVVLGYTEDVWTQLFRQEGKTYREPVLTLFRNGVESACGMASSASGPFYCPQDEKVYIDLSFFEEMQSRLNAPGDFAMAYVIAHEVGHHVQNLLGLMRNKELINSNSGNKASVMIELQADFLAGVWAHHAQQMKSILDPGDIDEALNAANAIGDDRLQKETQGYVVPESFTHGTSRQRIYWFKKGFETGDIHQGDTGEDSGLEP
jgi:predicted metalloprotease